MKINFYRKKSDSEIESDFFMNDFLPFFEFKYLFVIHKLSILAIVSASILFLKP
jgi:hypothetical protein